MKSVVTADDIHPYASHIFHSYHRIGTISRTANDIENLHNLYLLVHTEWSIEPRGWCITAME